MRSYDILGIDNIEMSALIQDAAQDLLEARMKEISTKAEGKKPDVNALGTAEESAQLSPPMLPTIADAPYDLCQRTQALVLRLITSALITARHLPGLTSHRSNIFGPRTLFATTLPCPSHFSPPCKLGDA